MMRPTNYKLYFKSSSVIPRRTTHRLKKRLSSSCRGFSTAFKLQSASVDNTVHPDSALGTEAAFSQSSKSSDSSVPSSSSSSQVVVGHLDQLFPNAKLTKTESLLLVYSFLLKHNLSKTATQDLLNLINFHLPQGISIPTSVFLLEKEISPDYSAAVKKVYCPNCYAIVDDKHDTCHSCLEDLSKEDLIKKGSFFVSFDIQKSLQRLLEVKEVARKLHSSLESKASHNNYTDISSGECYKKLKLLPQDFTCTVNTDGVNLFKSSRFGLWPILISINELDYPTRNRYTTLAGLWFGAGKPCFGTFLKDFVQQCNRLSAEGINWNFKGSPVQSFVYFPIFAADSVARCALQGLTQFNGEHGCPWCLIKGESYSSESDGRRWIYPVEEAQPRTHDGMIGYVKTVEQNLSNGTHKNTFGIKAASELFLLKRFDIVNGFVFDYMHTVLLGVVRAITMRWFDSANNAEAYYLGTKIDRISDAFIKVKVPLEISRNTRDLKDLKFWKASEWKTWMLVAIPVLYNIQKNCYLVHFSKLVESTFILTKAEILSHDLYRAEKLLNEFCSLAENLYGKTVLSFNMHILLHAADCVKNWGPLWSYSLFQFENFNGKLCNWFSGKSQICMQIVKRIILYQEILSKGNAFSNLEANGFFNSLLSSKQTCSSVCKIENYTFLGPKRPYILNSQDLRGLEKLGVAPNGNAISFHSVIFENKKLVVSKRNTSKRNNSIVMCNGNLYILAAILLVNQNISLAVLKRIYSIPFPNHSIAYRIIRVSESQTIAYLSEVNFKLKFICIYNANDVLDVVCPIPNVIELE